MIFVNSCLAFKNKLVYAEQLFPMFSVLVPKYLRVKSFDIKWILPRISGDNLLLITNHWYEIIHTKTSLTWSRNLYYSTANIHVIKNLWCR